MPHLNAIQQEFAVHEDFSFVSVSCGADLQAEDLKQLHDETAGYLREEGFTFSVYADQQGLTRLAIAEMAQLHNTGLGYPINLIIGRDGVICGFWTGYAADLKEKIVVTLRRELKRKGQSFNRDPEGSAQFTRSPPGRG
jgi:hypothetical protein